MRIKIGNKIVKSNLSKGQVKDELMDMSDGNAANVKVESKDLNTGKWTTVRVQWLSSGLVIG